MNRRSFFQSISTVAAGFMILPSATTYARSHWKKTGRMWIPNPAYKNAPYECVMYTGCRTFRWSGPPSYVQHEIPTRFEPIPGSNFLRVVHSHEFV